MDYQLKRTSKNKHLKLKVNELGEVIVTAPKLVPKIFIDRFVTQQTHWISRQQHKLHLKKNANPLFDPELQIVSYIGYLYHYSFDPSIDKKIAITSGNIKINPITGEEKDINTTLINWLKTESKHYIHNSLAHWSVLMNLEFKKVSFKQQSSRWGSCSSQGNLNFNWRLIHFKPEVIDYVVIHELAHLKHHDHSKAFWNLVAHHDTNYKTHLTTLKKQVIIPLK